MTTTTANQLTKHPFLAGLDAETMLKGAVEREFAPGEILFREGDPANAFYLIESGAVMIETRNPSGTTEIQAVGAGDVLGWSWLFPPFAWHFQARAVEPTRAIRCDGGHLLVTAEENPRFGYDLMRRVSQVVIQRLQATRERLAARQAVLEASPGTP
jgi:CRP-like cAMP-binding protein